MANDDQPKLLDDRKIDITYVDFEQALMVPARPMVYKAQRLQVVLEKFEKLLQTSPQQFSMQNYMAALTEYTNICEKLNKGITTDDSSPVARDVSESKRPAEVGERVVPGLDTGISADNPFARKGPDSV